MIQNIYLGPLEVGVGDGCFIHTDQDSPAHLRVYVKLIELTTTVEYSEVSFACLVVSIVYYS